MALSGGFGSRLQLVFVLLTFSVLGCSRSTSVSKPIVSFEEFRAMEALATTAPATAPTPAPGCALKSCEERRQEFRYVVYLGKQIYCYWDLKQADTATDFTLLANTLEAAIVDPTTSNDYYLVLRAWASAFHDGHVNVIAKSDLTGLEVFTAPVRVEVLAPATDHEKVIISNVTGSVGLAVGDEVVSVGGVAVADALTQAAKISASGSTARMRRFSAGRRLVDVLGVENGSTPLEIHVKPYAGGPEKAVTLAREIQINANPGKDTTDAGTTGAELITARILPGGIGYLRLDGFSGSQDDFLLGQAMDRLANTTGLILDLRKNSGGDLSGDRIIERLATSSVTRYKRSERLNDFILSHRPENFSLTADPTGFFAMWHDLLVTPGAAAHYAKPVVVLISPYCFSACDTFSSALKTNSLATFIGESTGGGTGTPVVFDLPVSPFQFRYSVVRGQDSKGALIEGIGTSPDIVLEPTVADRVTGKDAQLAKAVEVVQTLVSPPTPPKPINLSSVSSPALQTLDLSPTQVENSELLRWGQHDEL